MSKLAVSLLIGAALAGSFGSTLGQAKRGLAGLGKELGDGLEKGVAKARLGQALAKDLQAAQRRIHEVQGAASRALQPNPRIKTALAEAHLAYRKVTEEAKKYNLTLTDGARDAARFAAEERKLGQAMQAHARMGQALAARDAVTERRGELRGQLLGAVGMGLTLAAPVKVAANFEASMARVGAVAKLDLAGEEFKLLTATARELGATTAWSASEAAGGMQYLAMAGMKTNDIVAAMPGMLNLATAGNIDLAQAADIASNVLSSFKMPAERMDYLGDVLTNTFTSSNTSLAMLGDTMQYVAPVAASLGVSVETVAAMAGKLGDVGIQGSEAGTAMRAMYARMASPPKEAAKMLRRLGVQTKDAKGNLRDMPTILAEMHAAMAKRGLGSAQRADLMATVFGVEALAAATELMDQASTGKLQEFVEQIKEEGAAAEVARKQRDTLLGQFKELGSATESLAISIGNVLAPVVRGTAAILTRAATAVDAFANAHPVLTKVVVGAVAGLIAFKAASVGLGYALTFVTGPLHSLRAGMALLQTMRLARAVPALGGLTSAFGSLGGVLPVVLGGVKAIGAALFASPIGIAVAALAGAALLVWKYWGPIKSFFTGLWEGISSAAAPAAAAIGSALAPLGAMLAPVWDTIKDLGSAIGDFFGGDIFGSLFAQDAAPSAEAQHMGQRIGAALVNGVKFVFMNFTPVGLAIQAFGPVYEFVSTLGTRMARAWDAVVAKAQAAWTGVGQFFTGLGQTMAGIWDSVLAGLAAVPGQIQAVLGQALQFLSSIDLSGAGARLIQTFISGITSMAGAAYDAVKGVLSKIPGLFNNSDAKEGPLSNVTHQGGMLVQTLGAGIRGIGAGPLVDPLGQHLDAVATLLRAAPGLTAGVGTGVGAGVGTGVGAGSGSSGSPGAPGGPGAFGGPDSPGGGLTIHYAPQITVQSSGGAGQDVAGGIAQALAQDKEALARLIRELLHQERRLSYA